MYSPADKLSAALVLPAMPALFIFLYSILASRLAAWLILAASSSSEEPSARHNCQLVYVWDSSEPISSLIYFSGVLKQGTTREIFFFWPAITGLRVCGSIRLIQFS